MTIWLKKRLAVLFCAALLCGGATYLHAQNDYPAPAATPEKAGERFAQVLALQTGEDAGYRNYNFGQGRFTATYDGVVSRRNVESLGEGLPRLMQILALQTRIPAFKGRTVSNDGQNAVVEVQSDFQPKFLPLVVVAEDGGWRVDAVATYAKVLDLKGDALADNLFSVTGVVPRGLGVSSNMARAQCQSNLKQIMLGVMQYSQDWDERLPRARAWTDDLQPYVKSRQLFICPALPAGKSGGYAFNQKLSQIDLNRIDSMATTVNVYETSNGSANVFGPGTGRAYRHQNGANFAFADGHVKWFARGDDAGLKFNP